MRNENRFFVERKSVSTKEKDNGPSTFLTTATNRSDCYLSFLSFLHQYYCLALLKQNHAKIFFRSEEYITKLSSASLSFQKKLSSSFFPFFLGNYHFFRRDFFLFSRDTEYDLFLVLTCNERSANHKILFDKKYFSVESSKSLGGEG